MKEKSFHLNRIRSHYLKHASPVFYQKANKPYDVSVIIYST
jgi:hypothetical protein